MADKIQSKFNWKLNHYIALVLMGFIFFAANFVGFKHYKRANYTINNSAELTDLSKNFVSHLSEKITIINFVAPKHNDPSILVAGNVRLLLDEYKYYGQGKIEIKHIDHLVDFEEAEEASKKYNLTEDESVVIVVYKDQWKVIPYTDLALIDVSKLKIGGGAKVKFFKAEEAITSTLQSLVQGERAIVYFLTGHGELDPLEENYGPTGLSRFVGYLKRQNVEIRSLHLIKKREIPKDADLLVILRPYSSYTDYEIELLRSYLLENKDNSARLILCLSPLSPDTGLEQLLVPFGVVFDRNMVMAKVKDNIGRSGVLKKGLGSRYDRNHPVTQWISKRPGILDMDMGVSQSISLQKSELPNPPTVTQLIETISDFWGETKIEEPDAVYDPEEDKKGPLTLAVAIDSGSVADGKVQLEGSRIIAVGAGSFLQNKLLRKDQLDFFLNSVNWMLNKKEALGITPKTPRELGVHLSDGNKTLLFQILFIGIPFIGLILGFLVWLRRRK